MSGPQHVDVEDPDLPSSRRTAQEQLVAIMEAEPKGRPKNGDKPLNRIMFDPHYKDPTTEAFREKVRKAAGAPKREGK